ncbi:hypothetical protein KA977_03875, partial [Candidatus Dependentiae bacterium]|nr:hypothetical protein [Candidatus Dependentiae bacterium]
MKLKNKLMIPSIGGLVILAVILVIAANYYSLKNFDITLKNGIVQKKTDIEKNINYLAYSAKVIA